AAKAYTDGPGERRFPYGEKTDHWGDWRREHGLPGGNRPRGGGWIPHRPSRCHPPVRRTERGHGSVREGREAGRGIHGRHPSHGEQGGCEPSHRPSAHHGHE